jgi:hypothetical protein
LNTFSLHFKLAGFMVFNATFNNIIVISWRSVLLVEATGVSGEKTTYLPKVTDKLYYIMSYTLPWAGFKLTTSVMIGTYCIGSCKSNYHVTSPHFKLVFVSDNIKLNKRLPGACNRSPGSKLLPITTQLHCGGHLGGRAWLPDTILEEDHPMTIPSKFGSNWATGSRQDGFYVNFP